VKEEVTNFLNGVDGGVLQGGSTKVDRASTKMHRQRRRLCRKLEEKSSFPVMYGKSQIKHVHWKKMRESYFTDTPRI